MRIYSVVLVGLIYIVNARENEAKIETLEEAGSTRMRLPRFRQKVRESVHTHLHKP
jgi:hypothetical protein